MANEEHLDILKQGVEVWNQWRIDHPEIRPDLSDAYLDHVDLGGGYLPGTRSAESVIDGIDYIDLIRAGVDLRNANLCNAQFNYADLTYADFSDADLSGVYLMHAILNDATFSSAILREAALSHAYLIRANLNGARLGNADLSGVDLCQATLQDTNFNRVSIANTVFAANDLSVVKGLEWVDHGGPSFISLDTIYKSKGNIPEAFLRGCGLSDWEIESAKLYRDGLTPAQITDILYRISELRSNPALLFHSAFISYSHADKPFARRLHDHLQARGIRCWLDEHQLLPGHDIHDEIDRGIRLYDKVLLCCSRDSLASWWVDKEITTAFDKEQALWKERGKKTLALIPLNLDGYMFSGAWQDGKAISVKSRLAADFTGWETDNAKFEHEFERLVKALRADGGDREAPPAPQL